MYAYVYVHLYDCAFVQYIHTQCVCTYGMPFVTIFRAVMCISKRNMYLYKHDITITMPFRKLKLLSPFLEMFFSKYSDKYPA